MNLNAYVRGHTTVILMINMKRFIAQMDQRRFETLRHSKDFSNTLQNSWLSQLSASEKFLPFNGQGNKMVNTQSKTEFTSTYWNNQSPEYENLLYSPEYRIEKSSIDLLNFASNNSLSIFEDFLLNWDITLRPTNSGFFAIYLTDSYEQKNVSTEKLSHRIINLQQVVDINISRITGNSQGKPQDFFSLPIQWAVATIVIMQFIKEIGFEISLDRRPPIQFTKNDIDFLSTPYNQITYLYFQFDEILIRRNSLKLKKLISEDKKILSARKIEQGTYIRDIARIFLSRLGADEEISDNDWEEKNIGNNYIKFRVQSSHVTIVGQYNKLRTSKSNLQHKDLTSFEQIVRYAIEFRLVTKYIENRAFDIAETCHEFINRSRDFLFSGEIVITDNLPDIATNIEKLENFYLIYKRISSSDFWFRSEFTKSKTNFLFEKFDIQGMFENIERSLDMTRNFVNHVDNLYSLDLSEKNNDFASLAMLLTASSLLLTFVSLPSFWSDIRQLFIDFIPQFEPHTANSIQILLNWFAVIGTIIILIVFVFSIYLLISIRKQFQKRRASIQRILS